MKQIFTILFFFAFLFSFAQTNPNHVYVSGYYRSNGTYVQSHYRTAPNSTNRDNFSTRGNTNPYTGQAGYITPDNSTSSLYTPSTYSNSTTTYPIKQLQRPHQIALIIQQIFLQLQILMVSYGKHHHSLMQFVQSRKEVVSM
jgi:hypothetical protein